MEKILSSSALQQRNHQAMRQNVGFNNNYFLSFSSRKEVIIKGNNNNKSLNKVFVP